MTHIKLRNGIYYIRIRVPASLVPILGQHEVYRSLKTSNVRLATKRCGLLRAALIDFFAEAQEGALQRKDIKAKLDGLFHEILETQCHYIDRYGPKSRNRIGFLNQLSLDVQEASEAMREGDARACFRKIDQCQDRNLVMKRFDQAMKLMGGLSQVPEVERRMIRAEVLTMLSHYFHEAANLHGESKRYIYDPAKLTSLPAEPSELLISKALSKYATEKKRAKKWTPKTAGEIQAPVNDLIEICGDIPVKSLSKDDAVRFKDTLAALPPNVSKLRNTRFPEVSLREIAERKHQQLVSPRTVNKRLTRISSLFEWCVANHYCSDNPFKGLRVEEAKRKASDERDAFETGEVQQIIALAEEQAAWKKWVPLIGVYSGMRLNEICQLYKEDIFEHEGIWCFSVTDQRDDQKIKTASAKRLVPIHSKLIGAGLLDYAQGIQDGRLFPELRDSKNGYGDAPGKWFNRTFRGKLDLKPGQKTFHSLRHTFITALKRCKVDTPITNALVGHAEQSLAYGRYGKDYELSSLKDEIEKVCYDGARQRSETEV